ncbi:hypothetical protein [Streptomyces sp. MB09-01]|uniref:hypothetical protein n=1 Tax=Streptomyces sp. MB09-01 TaxID=3028666 RepID=UPI0029C9D40F|nr:hypothetical protein [Streptomyces sp. MB09-01]
MSSVEELRTGVRTWLRAERLAPERHMAAHGRTCLGRPVEHGLDDRERLFPFSRAGTVCAAGSDGIRRTLTAERILGLPKEVRA